MATGPARRFKAALRALDPDDAEFVPSLVAALEILGEVPDPPSLYADVFDFIESHDDVDMGGPGPIVHALEELGGYEQALRDSLRRRPVDMALWMVHRILNSKPPKKERTRWLAELRRVRDDPQTSTGARSEAVRILDQHGP